MDEGHKIQGKLHKLLMILLYHVSINNLEESRYVQTITFIIVMCANSMHVDCRAMMCLFKCNVFSLEVTIRWNNEQCDYPVVIVFGSGALAN